MHGRQGKECQMRFEATTRAIAATITAVGRACRRGPTKRRAKPSGNRSGTRRPTRPHDSQTDGSQGDGSGSGSGDSARGAGHGGDLIDSAISVTCRLLHRLRRAQECHDVLDIEHALRLRIDERLDLGDAAAACDSIDAAIHGLSRVRDLMELELAGSIGLVAHAQEVRARRLAEGEPPDYSRATRAARAKRCS
jgi:hypothetical protein